MPYSREGGIATLGYGKHDFGNHMPRNRNCGAVEGFFGDVTRMCCEAGTDECIYVVQVISGC
jgi:hypothetical protein